MPQKNFPVFHVVSNHFVGIDGIVIYYGSVHLGGTCCDRNTHHPPVLRSKVFLQIWKFKKDNRCLATVNVSTTNLLIQYITYRSYVYTKRLAEISRKYIYSTKYHKTVHGGQWLWFKSGMDVILYRMIQKDIEMRSIPRIHLHQHQHHHQQPLPEAAATAHRLWIYCKDIVELPSSLENIL